MRAAALLACAGLVPAGAFSTAPEQLETRGGPTTYVKVKDNAYCGNRHSGGHLGKVASEKECAAKVMADAGCGNGFSYGELDQYCDCPPVGEPCTAVDFVYPPYAVFGFKMDKMAPPEPQYCGSRTCDGVSPTCCGQVVKDGSSQMCTVGWGGGGHFFVRESV